MLVTQAGDEESEGRASPPFLFEGVSEQDNRDSPGCQSYYFFTEGIRRVTHMEAIPTELLSIQCGCLGKIEVWEQVGMENPGARYRVGAIPGIPHGSESRQWTRRGLTYKGSFRTQRPCTEPCSYEPKTSYLSGAVRWP